MRLSDYFKGGKKAGDVKVGGWRDRGKADVKAARPPSPVALSKAIKKAR